MVKNRKKEIKNRKMINGEELRLDLPVIFQDVCCDCGLVHFRYAYLEKNKLVIKTFRDDYASRKGRS